VHNHISIGQNVVDTLRDGASHLLRSLKRDVPRQSY